MKLYIVMLLNGLIGGTVGPLPYDMDQCVSRVADMNAEIALKGNTALRLECRPSKERPKHDPSFGPVEKLEKPS